MKATRIPPTMPKKSQRKHYGCRTFCAPTIAKEPSLLPVSLLEVESFCSAEDLPPFEPDAVDVIPVAARAATAASPVRVTPLDT